MDISPADPIGTFDPIAAWLSLTPVQRDTIGVFAIRAAFGGFVAQEAFDKSDRLLTPEARAAGQREEDQAGLCLTAEIEAALPNVFGADGEDPEWILDDPRTDREIADAAITGLRRVLVPASLLAGA